MAHEIRKKDKVVLHGKAAWHGLGTVVQEAPTPEHALKLAGLEWSPLESDALYGSFAQDDDTIIKTVAQTHKMLVRSDHPETVLGIVGKNYTPVSNAELADLCYDVCSTWKEQNPDKPLKVETAGSLFDGRKVWFLLQADPFSVHGHKEDTVERYTLAFNGFDGTTSLQFLPTTIRVVCNNTLTGALRRGRTAKGMDAGIKILHRTGIKQRVAAAMTALQEVASQHGVMQEMADSLARKKLTAAKQMELYKDIYTAINRRKQFPEVVEHEDGTKTGARQRNKAVEQIAMWHGLFEQECIDHKWPRTAWTTVNSVTKWLDHDRPIRKTKNVENGNYTEHDMRIKGNIWGRTALQKLKAYDVALATA